MSKSSNPPLGGSSVFSIFSGKLSGPRIFKAVTLVLAFVFSASLLQAQNGTVKGRVSVGDTALPGATVKVKGTSVGTQTDVAGNYTISAAPGATLLISAIGYNETEVKVNNRQVVNVQMESAAKILDQVAGERPTIASVFYNRIRVGMPLQSDPTAQYNPDGEIEAAATAVHTASAYNTYSFAGLPPGPIANPGMSSIMAALYPAHTDYLYFVARNDGTHIFSRTLREHQHAIEVIRKLNAQGIALKGQRTVIHAAPLPASAARR